MLPSKPILFSKESQDAFENKIQPSTSFFCQNSAPVNNPEPPPAKPEELPKAEIEVKAKTEPEKKKKYDPLIIGDNAIFLWSEENGDYEFFKSYMTRVEQRFSSTPKGPTNKFSQFQNILRDLDHTSETPVDLYKKIEKLFGPEHKDLSEDFLLKFLPGQAAQVGRVIMMDRFFPVRMTRFTDLLIKTFGHEPTVLRKVIRELLAGLDSGNSSELPHVRAHPRLFQLFKSLFLRERPPER